MVCALKKVPICESYHTSRSSSSSSSSWVSPVLERSCLHKSMPHFAVLCTSPPGRMESVVGWLLCIGSMGGGNMPPQMVKLKNVGRLHGTKPGQPCGHFQSYSADHAQLSAEHGHGNQSRIAWITPLLGFVNLIFLKPWMVNGHHSNYCCKWCGECRVPLLSWWYRHVDCTVCCSDCKVIRDPQTHKSKGYGFVCFVHKEACFDITLFAAVCWRDLSKPRCVCEY